MFLRADDENLYSLSELTQLIIRNKAHQHNWPISTYIHPSQQAKVDKKEGGKQEEKVVPKGISMPKDIFHNLSDHQAGLDVSFIPLV